MRLVSQTGNVHNLDREFIAPDSWLQIATNVFEQPIESEVLEATVEARGTGSTADIIIHEADGLSIRNADLVPGDALTATGLVAANSNIDVTLSAKGSLLETQLGAGINAFGAGADITLTADEMNFDGGRNSISASGDLLIHAQQTDWTYRVGSTADQPFGDRQPQDHFTDTLTFGIHELEALKDGFASITIGRTDAGNEMLLGDAMPNPTSKSGNVVLGVDSSLKDRTVLLTDSLLVQGDFQVPHDHLDVQARIGQIEQPNIHNQLGGPDSGITADAGDINFSEQLVVGGWIVGLNGLNINVLHSSGNAPIFSFANELVSLKTDLGSRIAVGVDNGSVNINTNKTIQVAGLLDATGKSSHLNVNSDTNITILEGGIASASGQDAVVTLTAGEVLGINPGGAVIAGAKFIDVNGTPVAVKTADGSDAVLNSAHEIFIGGTVTTSDQMLINSAAPLNDYSAAFDALSTVDPNHPLLGHSQYGIYLTGTLTTLADNSDLNLVSPADILIRGNINVLGANSGLLIQSDRFAYIEGFIDVKADARIYGGIDATGAVVDTNSPAGFHSATASSSNPSVGSSVLVHTTSRIVTRDSGSSIDIRGAGDVDLYGNIVAGGTITQSGVSFSGPSSSISVTAGEQLYLDTGLLASGTVTLNTSGTPSSDDTLAALFPGKTLPVGTPNDPLSIVITTAGGATTAGLTTDGSGGGIVMNANGNIEILGTLNAGATVTQNIDANGKLLSETITYSTEPATLTINASGRAFIGGHTLNQAGDIVETGTFLRAAHALTVNGGSYPTREGLLVHAASELTVNDPDGSITLTSDQDATILGAFIAGGRIDTVRDANGGYLGRNFVSFGGDSTVTLQADGSLVIGQDITAGKTINIIGGAGVGSVPGLILQGSARLRTLRPDSAINLNAPGEIHIQAPGHLNEIAASGFIATNDGKLTSDLTIGLSINRVDFNYRGTVTISAADTADNTGIADLVGDLRSAIHNATFTVFNSHNAQHANGSTFTDIANDPSTPFADPDVDVELRDGKLLLVGPYEIILNPIELLASITGAAELLAALGFDTSSGPLTSSRTYAIDAAQPGSVVNVGAPLGPNGKLTIEGKVRAYNAINLYSGTSPDGTDIDLGPTGVLETIDGSIAFNVGQYGNVRGSIIANGTGSDINISAAERLRIAGHLSANDDINLSTTTDLQSVISNPQSQIPTGFGALTSILIDGTSALASTGGGGNGEIIITGYNDVVFDGVVGTGSNKLARLELNAEHGNLTIPKTSGRIESDALIFLKGQTVDVQGVVRSTASTPSTSDFEITIDASDTAIIEGDLQLTGSLHIDADNVTEVFNTTIAISTAGQTLLFTGGDVRFGKVSTDSNGDLVQLGALITAVDHIEFNNTGTVEIGSGSIVATSGKDSLIEITAKNVAVAGSLLAGATITSNSTVFGATGADIVIDATESVTLGGTGIINGASVSVGGNVRATGDIDINVTGGSADISFSLSAASAITTETATNEPANTPHSISISTDQNMQLLGTITALQDGADVTLSSGELIYIDGLVDADDQLSITGGADETDFGLIVTKFVFATDSNGDPLLDANNEPIRISGGTVTTNVGGTLTLAATEQLALSGVIGQTHKAGSVVTADTSTIRITDGLVIVDGAVNAGDLIEFNVDGVMIAADGYVQTRNAGSQVDLRASGLFMLGAATGTQNPATIVSDQLIHIFGDELNLDGLIFNTATNGRVVINATSSASFFGTVTATGTLDVRAGVNPFATTSQLLGALTIADLIGGDVEIIGGELTSTGAASIIAGGDIEVLGTSSVGSNTVTVTRPIIVTTPLTIDVVTGTQQVATGTILVPEVTFVTTETTRQVGTESVRVGSEFHTADMSLTQIGYYNATTNVTRKYFIEDIDYSNDDPALDFSKVFDPLTGNIITLGTFTRPSSTTEWGALTDLQRDSVLIKLGYRKLYVASFSNFATNRTINGIPTIAGWSPSWATSFTTAQLDTTYEYNGGSGATLTYKQYSSTVTRQLSIDGLRDKYIVLPTGAENDILRVVSQGTPTTVQEDVGNFRDRAVVNYVQDRSANVVTYEQRLRYDPYSHDADGNGYVFWGAYTTDDDNSIGRWAVDYRDSGMRDYFLSDGTNASEGQLPEWYNSTTRDVNYDAVNRYSNVKHGYFETTASINNVNLLTTRASTKVGTTPFGNYYTSNYSYNNTSKTFDNALNDSYISWDTFNAVRGFLGATPISLHDSAGAYQSLAHILNGTQNAAVDALVGNGGQVWVGGKHFNDDSWAWVLRNLNGNHTLYDVDRYFRIGGSTYVNYRNWDPGEPSGDGAAALEFYGSNGRWNDESESDGHHYITQTNSYWTGTNLNESFLDYTANWTSTYRDITDTRLQLSYQLVTNAVDLYDLRPKYEVGSSTTKVVTNKSVTQWATQNITEQQTVLVTEVQTETLGPAYQGEYNAPSISAVSGLTIAAGNDLSISAIVQSTGTDQSVTLSAGRDASINGLVPDGAAPGTLPAIAQVLSDGNINITAGRDALLGPASNVQTDADNTADAQSTLTVTASRNASIGGEVSTLDIIVIDAAGDIALVGNLSTTNKLSVAAGTDGSGSITGDINGSLTTTNGPLTLTAGATSGSITLDGTTLTNESATGDITFTAAGGSIAQSQGAATAKSIHATAKTGIALNAQISELTLSNTGTGNVSVINVGDLTTLGTLSNANGSISLTTFGTLTVGEISGSGAIDLLTSKSFAQSSGTTIGGGALSIDSTNAAYSLKTAVTGIELATSGPGNVVINNTGTAPLTLNIVVADGSLNVDTKGNLIVEHVISATNKDANDITLSATGNMQIGYLNAGVFAATEDEARTIRLSYLSGALRNAGFLSANAPDLTEATYATLDVTAARTSLINWFTANNYVGLPNATALATEEANRQLALTQPLHSEGDLSLTAGGSITELTPEDTDVDLIADTLTVVSGNGISGIEMSLNTVASLTNTTGSVSITDIDSVGETDNGIVLTSLTNNDGSISVTTNGDLDVGIVTAKGTNADVSLVADGVLTLQPVSGVTNTVTATSGLTLDAGGTLILNSGFTAPDAVSLTSNVDVVFASTSVTLSTAEPIVIQSGSSIRINGTLESDQGITLISEHGDVSVNGKLQGRNGNPLPSLTIIAYGNLVQSGQFEGQYRFESQLNGATYYADTPNFSASSNVVDSSGNAVSNPERLDLIPFTTTGNTVAKDPLTGRDMFRDPNTGKTYYRTINANGETFAARVTSNGRFVFSAYLTAVPNGVSVPAPQVVPGFVTIYGTTNNPQTATFYLNASDTTPLSGSALSRIDVAYETLTDPTVIARLVPITLKDLNGGKPTGTGIALNDAIIGTVSGSITLIAQGEIIAPTLTVPGNSGTITVISGNDLVPGNWSANTINLTSTGFVDFEGTLVSGSVNVNPQAVLIQGQPPVNVSLTTQNLNITARNDINLNRPVNASHGVLLHAGDNIFGLGNINLSVSGSNSYIDLATGADFVLFTNLNANGPITLTSYGYPNGSGVRTGGSVIVNAAINTGSGALTINSTDTNSILNATFTGSGGLIVGGTGTLTIPSSPTQNFSGPIIIESGNRLVLNAAVNTSQVTVEDNATLSGKGSINGPVLAETGSSTAPGNSPGKLTVNGNYTFEVGSTYNVEVQGNVAGSGYDQLEIAGANRIVTLTGAALAISTLAIPSFGSQLIIINNVDASSTIVGEFDGIPDGFTVVQNGINYVVDYQGGDGNDVVLTTSNFLYDFGDAPTSAQSGFASSYPTLKTDSGANHIIGGPRLGASVDADSDGSPSATASAHSDDDGIAFLATLIRSSSVSTIASISVDLQNADAASNRLDGWIDFNRDGDWDDVGEHIFNSTDLGTTDGTIVLSFTIPAGSTLGSTFARFRLSTAGGLSPSGDASDGEVEDYGVTLLTAGSPTTITAPSDLSGPIVVTQNGSNIVVTQGAVTLQQIPLSGAGALTLNGTTDRSDLFIIDLSDGNPIPSGGISVNGLEDPNNADDDKLSVIGTGQDATYSPSSTTPGNGTITFGASTIHFSNLEPVDLTNFTSVTFDAPNADNVIDIANGVDFATGTIPALIISGTTGGIAFETLAVSNTTTMIVNTTTPQGSDAITISGLSSAANVSNLQIIGGTGVDSLAINGDVTLNKLDVALTGNITQANATTITVSDSTTLDAGTGNIALTSNTNDFQSSVSLTGNNISINDANALTLTATATGTLDVAAGGKLSASSSSATGAASFTATGFDIVVTASSFQSAASFNGLNVDIGSTSALDFGSSNITGKLTVNASGNITDSGAINVIGATQLTALTHDITLDTPTNNFIGAVSASGHNIDLRDRSELALGTVIATGTLSILTDGDITDGQLTVTGTAQFDANLSDILLDAVANQFGGSVSLNGNDALLNAAGNVDLGDVTLTGSFHSTLTGNFTDSGTLSIGGTTTLNVGTHDITLNSPANDFMSSVTLTARDATLVDSNSFEFGTTALTGKLQLATGGDVTQTGTLTIDGTTTLLSLGSTVTLDDANNDFVGTVFLTTNSVSLTDKNSVDLGASTVSGNLSVTANGTVTDSGSLSIIGTTTITATGFDVTLDDANNDFSGALSLTADDATIVDRNDIELGTLQLSGKLVLTAGGNVTQSGPATITGTTSLTATGFDITLDNTDNNFVGSIGLNAHNVTLIDIGPTDLSTSTITGDLALTVQLPAASAKGATTTLTDSGALTINGTTTISAPEATVTLDSPTNDFGGTLSITARDTVLVDQNALDFGASSINGTLDVTTSGAITDSGALLVTGATELDSGTGDITLDDAANDFIGALTATGGNITVVDNNSLTLTSLTGTQATITTGDALTLVGKLDAGAGTVTLNVNQEFALSAADNFTMQVGSSIVTTNDTSDAVAITINSLLGGTGNALLQAISTGTTNGRVTIDAASGSIVDSNGTTTNITSNAALLRALNGVGSALDPLETTVSNIAGVGGAGGFFVINSQGLTVTQLASTSGVMTTSGDIAICTTSGSLTIANNITSTTGNILLKAIETVGSNNITVNAGVSLSAIGGNLTLEAGDDITLTGTSHLTAGKSLAITADSGDADTNGSRLTIAAELDSGTGTTISSGNDNDTFIITYPDLPATNSGTVNIVDLGGTDAVVINGTAAVDELSIKTTTTTTTVTRGNPAAEDIVFTSSIDTLRVNGLAGNDVLNVQPSILQPITIDGGAPGYAGPGTPPGNTLNLDTFGNSFSLVAPQIFVQGGQPTAFKPITIIGIQRLPIEPVSPLVNPLKFDFNEKFNNGTQTATQTGFTGVPQDTVYNPTAVGAPGTPGTYGWDRATTGFVNRPTTTGTLADLSDDGHFFDLPNPSQWRTFTANVPNGYVLVTVDYGSWNAANTGFQILNGDNGQVLASNLSTANGKSNSVSFVTRVQDGSLDLRFKDPSDDDNRRISIHGIEIVPAVLLTMGFDVSGPLTADGTTVDTFTIFNAPANSFVTIKPSNGTLVGTDASTRFDGYQVTTNALGQATFSLRRPSAGGLVAVELTTPTGEAYSSIAIEYGAVTARNFDFNTPNSATYSPFDAVTNPNGYLGVIPSDLFTEARGYGWLTQPDSNAQGPIAGLATSDLVRDAHRGTAPGTFRVALPDGDYSVHATIGGVGDHQGLSLVANGTPVVSNMPLKHGNYIETTFNVTVSGGLLDLTFSHNDGNFYDRRWSVSGLEIVPLSAVLPITPTANFGAIDANGSTVTTITAAVPGAANGTLITVSSSLGTITTPDANQSYLGTQVLVTNGSITFQLQSPTKSGTPTIDLHSINGLYHTTLASGAFLDFVIPSVRRLDFNKGLGTTQSPTAAGFIPVSTDAKPATNGFGWTHSMTNSFNNNIAPGKTTTALYQDGHYGSSLEPQRTFNVEAQPGQTYNVRVYIDRVSYTGTAFDQLQLTVEGAGQQFVATTASLFTSLYFASARDLNNDGFIGISIADLGGAQNGWALNGLDIVRTGATDPGAAPLTATEVRSSSTDITKLTEPKAREALSTIINLLAPSLTADEVARLSAINISIADMNDRRALGLTLASNLIILDDDGTGLGWHTDDSAPTSSEDGYDLLTVLAHELLHSLGADHTEEGLMSPTLEPGIRELDDLFSSDLLHAIK